MAELRPGLKVDVVRGRHAGRAGVVHRAHAELENFWWVELYLASGALGLPLVLSGGQLEPQVKTNGLPPPTPGSG